ncbi:hypothetical protein JTB14_031649 [Gonioctena quinquepunctata]|nr:hypothetical protein JTB14_031649 [Gonioctena quinquepunctata]
MASEVFGVVYDPLGTWDPYILIVHRNKPLTTADLLDELERLDGDDGLPNVIYITPPNDNGNKSDEDPDLHQDEYFDDEESEKGNEMENDVIEAETERVPISNQDKI